MDPKRNIYISLLRGVNVGGQNRVPMAELCRLYEDSNLLQPETYVQSGNVVFLSAEPDASKLSAMIEKGIRKRFGHAIYVFIRAAPDFDKLVRGNPFLQGRREDPTKLHVTFLHRAPAEQQLNSLKHPGNCPDEFMPRGREVFLFCPRGYGRTRLSNTFFENKLRVPATTRNWRTVLALHRMVQERTQAEIASIR